MPAALLNVPANVGYPLLFVLVGAESAGALVPGETSLCVVASWLAGANRMRGRRFLLWNSLGGIAWASTVGAAAYLLGRSASGSLGAIGFAGLAIAALLYPGEPHPAAVRAFTRKAGVAGTVSTGAV
jgi:membrane protein DedA with SNARE-associated domain